MSRQPGKFGSTERFGCLRDPTAYYVLARRRGARPAEPLRIRVGPEIAPDLGAGVSLDRHDKACLLKQLLHRLVVRKILGPQRFALRLRGAMRDDIRDGPRAVLHSEMISGAGCHIMDIIRFGLNQRHS